MYLQVLYYLHLLLCESIRIQVNVVLQLLKFTNGKIINSIKKYQHRISPLIIAPISLIGILTITKTMLVVI